MTYPPTDCSETDKQRESKNSKPNEMPGSKDSFDNGLSDKISEAVKNEFETQNKRKICFFVKVVFTILTALFLLLFQAVIYKDLISFLEKFSVAILIIRGILFIDSKKIKNIWISKIIACPVIKSIITLVLIAAFLSSVAWQIPTVKAKVTDIALSIVNSMEKKINENSEKADDEETEITIQETPQYNADAEFIINDYEAPLESYGEIFEKVYFYVNQNADAESILKHFNDIYGVKIPVGEGTRFYEIQAKEDNFISKQVKGVDYKEKNGINEEWYKMLPHENELIEVIRYQEEYAEAYPCYVIFLRLSNNYQRLGNEYLRQKASNSTIKYYYYMSLIYDYECIKYAENKSHFNSSLSRVYYRFKDVVSFCEITDSEREKARFVMEGLDNYKYLSP